MNDGLIPRRYAKALLLVAKERGVESDVYGHMKCLEQSFVEFPQLNETLNNPYVSNDDKRKLILLGAGVKPGDNATFSDFISLLIDNRRIGMVRLMAIAYIELYRTDNRIYDVNVQSAAELLDADEKRIKSFVEKHLDGGIVEYSHSVNPELIGGFTISVGNEKIDASVSNELKQLRLQLLSK